jgi:hypothetical protein
MGGGLCASLVLAAGVLSPAAASAYDSDLFTVDISSTAKRSESGNLFEFDKGEVIADTYGPSLFQSTDGLEVPELIENSKGDGTAKYGIATDVSTKVKIGCKGPSVLFNGAGSAAGNIETTFEDGFPGSFVYEAWGTGSAEAVGAFRANGDLKYPKAGESLGTTAGAVSSGDVPIKEISGEVAIPYGGKVTFTPTDGEEKNIAKPPLVGSDSATVAKSPFEVELLSYASSNIAASDSIGGRAHAVTLVDISHTLTVTGSCTLENRSSGLLLELIVPPESERPRPSAANRPPLAIGTLRIQTIQTPGGLVVEDITKTIRDDGESFYLSSDKPQGGDVTSKRKVDSDWDRPKPRPASFSNPASRPLAARHALLAGLQGQIGVAKGTAARYAVKSEVSGLTKLKRFRARVARVRAGRGQLVLDAAAKYRKGRSTEGRLDANPFTADGEIRGLFIPVGLEAGDDVYGGLGEVVASDDETVTVEYSDGGVDAVASYASATGMLTRIDEHGPGGAETTLRRVRKH